MKNRKLLILVSGIILMLNVITFILFSTRTEILENEHINRNDINNKMLSIMVETARGSGKYESYNGSKWPDGVFNENLSRCENGSTLIWNEETGAVLLEANVSDKCYVYFDSVPADVEMTITNQPTTVGAQANLNCNNATATYSQKYNRIEISAINNKRTACNLSFSQRTSKTYLNNKVIGLAGTPQGTGQVVNENGYRYEGKDPNNYVWFNNELWRIIGVFDSATHGVSGQNLVKIIRETPIGGLAWDKANKNNWTTSSLYKLLNPVTGDNESGAYYNATNGTGEVYCYSYSNSIPGNCDYSQNGIASIYRSMIKEVTWHLGGHTTHNATAATFYTAERGSATGNGNANPSTVTGYIGLMYLSDYGYSVLSNSCVRTTNLGSYNSSSCAGQSWLYGQGHEWTLGQHSSTSSDVFSIESFGASSNNTAINGFTFRPSLYLNVAVNVIDGNGSRLNPYIIGM